jgi:hypothetical protein
MDRVAGSTYFADRGTMFHDAYGPQIVAFLGIYNAELEQKYVIDLPCDRCKKGTFKFGGYVDCYTPSGKWLLDFKFSTHAADGAYLVEQYAPQLAAYAYLLIAAGKPVDVIGLLAIHPETFECFYYDVPVETVAVTEIATNYHKAKAHGGGSFHNQHAYTVPGVWCRYCRCDQCAAKLNPTHRSAPRLDQVVANAFNKTIAATEQIVNTEQAPDDGSDLF